MMETVKIMECEKFDGIDGYVFSVKIMDENDAVDFSFVIENNLSVSDFVENFEFISNKLRGVKNIL